jgi:hypothetical protein
MVWRHGRVMACPLRGAAVSAGLWSARGWPCLFPANARGRLARVMCREEGGPGLPLREHASAT